MSSKLDIKDLDNAVGGANPVMPTTSKSYCATCQGLRGAIFDPIVTVVGTYYTQQEAIAAANTFAADLLNKDLSLTSVKYVVSFKEQSGRSYTVANGDITR